MLLAFRATSTFEANPVLLWLQVNNPLFLFKKNIHYKCPKDISILNTWKALHRCPFQVVSIGCKRLASSQRSEFLRRRFWFLLCVHGNYHENDQEQTKSTLRCQCKWQDMRMYQLAQELKPVVLTCKGGKRPNFHWYRHQLRLCQTPCLMITENYFSMNLTKKTARPF